MSNNFDMLVMLLDCLQRELPQNVVDDTPLESMRLYDLAITK
jgi:hypothetical protein